MELHQNLNEKQSTPPTQEPIGQVSQPMVDKIPDDIKRQFIAESHKPTSPAYEEWKRRGQQLCYEVAYADGYQGASEAMYKRLRKDGHFLVSEELQEYIQANADQWSQTNEAEFSPRSANAYVAGALKMYNDKQFEIAYREDMIKERDQELSRLRDQLAAKDKEIWLLNEANATLQGNCNVLKDQLTEARNDAAVYQEQYKRAEKNIAALTNQLSQRQTALESIVKASQHLKDNPNCAYILRLAEEGLKDNDNKKEGK